MKWGWVLVTLYLGPIALLFYILSSQEPIPGSHDEFVKPLWKQGLGSAIHCVAGDATGIILAAVVTSLLGLPMWLDLIIEYLAFRLRPVHFLSAFHEGYDGWLLSKGASAILSAGVCFDEFHDGWHVPGDGSIDDGP